MTTIMSYSEYRQTLSDYGKFLGRCTNEVDLLPEPTPLTESTPDLQYTTELLKSWSDKLLRCSSHLMLTLCDAQFAPINTGIFDQEKLNPLLDWIDMIADTECTLTEYTSKLSENTPQDATLAFRVGLNRGLVFKFLTDVSESCKNMSTAIINQFSQIADILREGDLCTKAGQEMSDAVDRIRTKVNILNDQHWLRVLFGEGK